MSRPPVEPPSLPPEMAALLEAERRAPPPSAARQALILSRMQASVAATGAVTATAIATTATAVKAAPVVGGALAGAATTASLAKPLLLLALVTSTAGAIGGGMAVRKHRQAKVDRAGGAATAVASSIERTSPDPTVLAVPSRSPRVAPPPPGAASSPAPASPSKPSPPSRLAPAPSLDIAGEATVLEHARLSLNGGDASAALADVQLHARRFPRGVLSEERDALWIRALLQGGERAQAERRAATFNRNYPSSVHADSVARALREIP